MRAYKVETQEQARAVAAFGQVILPTGWKLAIYARQSTKEQVVNNRQAHDQQTKQLLSQGIELGWNRDDIVLFIENLRDGKWVNASGRLRIDQRQGLQALTERIKNGEVKAVLVWAVDRLFRDEDMIQPAVFAKLCKEHGCIVITMDDLFDFNQPRRDDRKRFLEIAQAADYITKHVKGRMLPARANLSKNGQADSRKISVGYIVPDRRRYLADGSDNPNYKRLAIYEPHAKIVRWLFRRYRELGGNLRALYRELEAWPYMFPFFEAGAEHGKYVSMGKNEKGYKITRGGLASLLTNVVYIGYWYYKGKIISRNNHPAIVDEADFWYAFNRLSPVTLDGEINHRPSNQHVHFRKEKPTIEALLDGWIHSDDRPVYVLSTNPPTYSITDTDKKHGPRYKVSIAVSELDEFFLARLFEVVQDSEGGHGETIEQRLKEVQALREQELISVDDQIEEVKQQIARAERDKRIAEEEDYEQGIREAIRELKSKRAILAELERKRSEASIAEEEIRECEYLLDCVYEGWNTLTLEKKRRFIHLITESITLTEVSQHFLRLEIVWTGPHGCTDVGYIWRMHGTGTVYTEEENAIIRGLYPRADRATILEQLPHRSWQGIMIQAKRLGLSRPNMGARGNSSSLHVDVSLQDNEILGMLGLEYDEKWPDKLIWWASSSDNNLDTPS